MGYNVLKMFTSKKNLHSNNFVPLQDFALCGQNVMDIFPFVIIGTEIFSHLEIILLSI